MDTELFYKTYSSRKSVKSFKDYVNKNQLQQKTRTQWNSLDDKLNGGIMPGLYCLGAISSLGKTAFSLQLASSLARQGKFVLYFSIEMSKNEMIARVINRIAFEEEPINYKDIGTLEVLHGFSNDKNSFEKYCNKFHDDFGKLCIAECGFDIDINSIAQIISDFINSFKEKPIVFIDYLQLVEHSEKDSKGNDKYLNDKQSIDSVTKKFKILSRKFDIPIWLISSFNRQSYKSHVSHECFKESGVIEYTSDVLMGLQLSVLDENIPKDKVNEVINNAKSKDIKDVTLVILKQRNGKSFVKQKFKFYAKNNYFREV